MFVKRAFIPAFRPSNDADPILIVCRLASFYFSFGHLEFCLLPVRRAPHSNRPLHFAPPKVKLVAAFVAQPQRAPTLLTPLLEAPTTPLLPSFVVCKRDSAPHPKGQESRTPRPRQPIINQVRETVAFFLFKVSFFCLF